MRQQHPRSTTVLGTRALCRGIDNDDANDKERKRRSRDLLVTEKYKDESDKVAKQHEQEKRENEGKKRMRHGAAMAR